VKKNGKGEEYSFDSINESIASDDEFRDDDKIEEVVG
jgi:hypothetical protein